MLVCLRQWPVFSMGRLPSKQENCLNWKRSPACPPTKQHNPTQHTTTTQQRNNATQRNATTQHNMVVVLRTRHSARRMWRTRSLPARPRLIGAAGGTARWSCPSPRHTIWQTCGECVGEVVLTTPNGHLRNFVWPWKRTWSCQYQRVSNAR